MIGRWTFSLAPTGRELDFAETYLTGTIPSQLGSLVQLTTLGLYVTAGAGLSGPLPLSFSKLQGLQSLALTNVNLSSTIPTVLSTLTSLTYVHRCTLPSTCTSPLFTVPVATRTPL